MKILGIETACDDTAAAVVEDGHKVLSNVVWGQDRVHKEFGGIVPELSARRQVESIEHVLQEALDTAKVTLGDIDAVAVNHKKGLLRALVIGVSAAKAIALARGIPLIGVHHVEAHMQSAHIDNPDIEYPLVCLTVSGGHNYLIYAQSWDDYEIVGDTLDDAAGEAYDKVARYLGLGFPGGPIIDRLAQEGNPEAYSFPRPMLGEHMAKGDYNFSFSGLKTSVVNTIKKERAEGKDVNVADVAASFQAAVVDVLAIKTLKLAEEMDVKAVTVVGGVSMNSGLRKRMSSETKTLRVIFPGPGLCTDNAAMTASLAYCKHQKGEVSDLDLRAYANASLKTNDE